MLTVEEANRSLNSEIVLHHLQISLSLWINTQKAPGEQKEALNREHSLDFSKDVFLSKLRRAQDTHLSLNTSKTLFAVCSSTIWQTPRKGGDLFSAF